MFDISKLSRDYIKEPLKRNGRKLEQIPENDLRELICNQNVSRKEICKYFNISIHQLKYMIYHNCIVERTLPDISKEELIQYYINETHSYNDTCKHFNTTPDIMNIILKKYNIHKTGKEMYQVCCNTMKQKYGVENAFQLESVKEKSKQTTLQKYGKEHFVQTEEYKNKNIETRINRYGESDPFQREKFKETCIEKYGVDNPDYAGFTTKQIKLINDKEYLEEYIKQNNIKNASELASYSGLTVSLANEISNKLDIRHLYDYTGSQYERILQQIVEQKGLDYIPNYKIPNSRKEIDIYIPSKHLGIEFNGDYWHSEMVRPANYHQNKSKLAEEQGIFIYHIFEYQWKEKSSLIIKEILELLGEIEIHQGNYYVNEVSYDIAKKFIEDNSLYKVCDITKSYGLYYEDRLVHIQSYLDVGDNKWDLLFDVNLLNEDYKNASIILLAIFGQRNKCNKLCIQTNVGYKNENFPLKIGYKLGGYFDSEYKWFRSGIVEERFDNDDIEKRHNDGWWKLYDCGIKYFQKL